MYLFYFKLSCMYSNRIFKDIYLNVHCLDDFLQMQFKFTESRLSVSLHSQPHDNKPRDKLCYYLYIVCVNHNSILTCLTNNAM